ncbi:MAG: putative histidine kinaserelated ATPase domain protein [Frankiales bacterium]|nr:putative histidine kinaserelated ATPase domain protein [Frankiales bacterium]
MTPTPEPAMTPAALSTEPGLPLRARIDLPLQEHACATARRTARLLLGTWDVVDDDRVHDVLVVVSELVGNAVRHGDVRVSLDLQLDPDGLVVAVSDGAATLPRQRLDEDDQAENGRGLAIVQALAAAWGTDELPDGKRVWARLRV